MDYRNEDKNRHPSATGQLDADLSGQDHTSSNIFIENTLDTTNCQLGPEESKPDIVLTLDQKGTIVSINQAVEAYGFTADEKQGAPMADFIHPQDRHQIITSFLEGVATRKDHVRSQQFRLLTKSKESVWVESNSITRFTPKGEFIIWEGVCRDITYNIKAQNALLQTQEALEEQVKIRTAELMRANEELQREILERRNKEQQLIDREADLQMEKANLQETNTALKVLLKQRESDKHGFEEQVMYNVKEMILPYLDKLKTTELDERQDAYLSILETNLGDITSTFSRRLSMEFYGLTTSELKVANFIRQGKRTREIASLLGLSQRTVETYRLSIRRKLRIKNKKANLRTLLLSME